MSFGDAKHYTRQTLKKKKKSNEKINQQHAILSRELNKSSPPGFFK